MNTRSFLKRLGIGWLFNLNPTSEKKPFIQAYFYADPAHFKDPATRCKPKFRTHVGKFDSVAGLQSFTFREDGLTVFETASGNVFAVDKQQAAKYLKGMAFNSFSM